MIKLENVDKYYNYRMDTQVHALKNVNLTIDDGGDKKRRNRLCPAEFRTSER